MIDYKIDYNAIELSKVQDSLSKEIRKAFAKDLEDLSSSPKVLDKTSIDLIEVLNNIDLTICYPTNEVLEIFYKQYFNDNESRGDPLLIEFIRNTCPFIIYFQKRRLPLASLIKQIDDIALIWEYLIKVYYSCTIWSQRKEGNRLLCAVGLEWREIIEAALIRDKQIKNF